MSDNPNFGDKEFSGVGFPTPLSIPEETTTRTFTLPANGSWEALVMGAMYAPVDPKNWQQFEGGITREEAAERWLAVFESGYDSPGTAMTPAPYWEAGVEADDELPPDEQPWYGYVSEGNFIEDAGVFLISNFLAAALTPQAAVLYATHQRKIRLSFLKGGLGGVVKVYAGDALAAVVDLFGTDGEVVDVDVITGYVDEAVEILQVLDSV